MADINPTALVLLDDAIASVQALEQAELQRMETYAEASEVLRTTQVKGEYPTAERLRKLEDAARQAIESLPLMDDGFDGTAVNALRALLPEVG